MTTANKSVTAKPRETAKLTPRQEAETLMEQYAKLHAEHAQRIVALNQVLEPLARRLKDAEDQLRAFADHYKGTVVFGGNRLLKLPCGEFGFRAGLKMLRWNADHTPEGYEAEAVKLVRKLAPSALVEKVDARTAARLWDDMPKLRAALEPLGAFVEQKDTFVCIAKK
jgi:hypothetical protein